MKKSSSDEILCLDKIIEKLLVLRDFPGKIMKLQETQIKALLMVARKVLLEQPMLLEIEAPVVIIGDIHGQFNDLVKHFDANGHPPHKNYLMLGDYVDRGYQSIETVCLLLAYKIKYPNNFFVLRGNHECASINRLYGFYDECKRRYNVKLWKTFTDVFNCLPLAARINDTILCMHGGISPELRSLSQINDIQRPISIPEKGLACDLLWSDPDTRIDMWAKNERGVSYVFGKVALRKFLDRFNLNLIVRAHQVVEDGYEFFADKSLVTIFSVPDYCGDFKNTGAAMHVNEDLTCWFSVLPPVSPKIKKK